MKYQIDIEAWKRKEHFEFFSSMDDPFFGMTVMVDCSRTYAEAKEKGDSFFLASLYKIMQAVNNVEPFRYRIEDRKVVCYDTIHVSSTVGRPDETFGFSFFEYFPEYGRFMQSCREEVERIQSQSGLCFTERKVEKDLIFFTTIPWLNFTEFKHAGNTRNGDSIPRISTGKMIVDGGRRLLPVSVHVHHGLMDGLHVARFFEFLESIL